jgi:hypothetical protein
MTLKHLRLITALVIIAGALVASFAMLPSGRFSWSVLLAAYDDPNGSGNDPSSTDPVVSGIVVPQSDGGLSLNFPLNNPNEPGPESTVLITRETLDQLPALPDENIEVASSDDGLVNLFKLTSGEFQVNVGPDSEGKIFVYIFTWDPVYACQTRYEYRVDDPTPLFVGPC